MLAAEFAIFQNTRDTSRICRDFKASNNREQAERGHDDPAGATDPAGGTAEPLLAQQCSSEFDICSPLGPGEMADDLLLASARVVPRRLEETGYAFRYPQLEPARRHVLGR
jgi:uncharacterized protein DUF1731